ncbi:MAG: dipeptidase [Solirubrobacterales bacterium]|nr:dipeptidase [Solirubrobacterales bacterium]
MQPVFDGHNDALTREDHDLIVAGRPDGHLDLPRLRQGGVRGAIFAIFSGGGRLKDRTVPRDDAVLEFEYAAPLDHVLAAADATAVAGRLARLERDGHLRMGRTGADLDRAQEDDGPPVAVLHLEGAEAIDPDLEALDFWYEAGLRSLGPVWSRANAFAWGVPFISPSSPDLGPGLTAAGRALVRRCAELGILVDVSHLNEAGFWDLAALEAGPIVASHAAAHALCPASRNLTDAQLDAIGASGGLVGIVFATPFLRLDFADDPDTPLGLIAEHARYVAERIGPEHVALGSDFDGATIPREVGGADGMPRVLEGLRQVGFSAGEVDGIAWNNWRRVLGAWWKG